MPVESSAYRCTHLTLVVSLMLLAVFQACAQQTAPPLPPGALVQFIVTEQFGVSHPDQIIDFELAKPVDPAEAYLIGPDGKEVPYQLLEDGKRLALRTNLPASRIAVRRALGFTCEKWAADYKFDTAGVEQSLSVEAPSFAPGDVVRVEGTTLPEGLERDTDYYVTMMEYREVRGGWGFFFIGLAATLDGPAIPITRFGNNTSLVAQALVADPAADQLYSRAHGLPDGCPVTFRTRGELPQPLQPGVTYYVTEATADRFSVTATRGGQRLDLTTLGDGVHELMTDWTWTLQSGRAPQPYPEAVQVREEQAEGVWEITNGRLGIRVPAGGIPPDPQRASAPVQGVQLRDATWTGGSQNTIGFAGGSQVKNITTTFVERGPLKVVVEIAYELDRGEYRYGQQLVSPAGPGKYRCRIEVQAGQPSVLFEEDTDCQFSYSFPLGEVTLNQARYNGHSVRDERHGYRPDGKPASGRGADSFFDLPFDANYASSYVTDLRNHLIRWMHPWDPWIFDSGNYWMLYDKDGEQDSPLIGYYDGRASRLRNAGAVGVGVYTRAAAAGAEPHAGLTVQAWQRSASAQLFRDPRFQWRLFIGAKDADMADWRETQPIMRQMNLHSGINLNKVANWQFDFPGPPNGYGNMYMSKDAVEAMTERIRTDQGFYNFAYNAVSYYRDLIDMWRDESGDRVHQMADLLWRGAHDGLNTLVNGGGIYGFGYWHAGLEASRALMRADQILSSDLATEADRQAVRQALIFYASTIWDDDHAPLSVPAGVNLGTANMPIQQQNYREMYALFLPEHPMMEGRTGGVGERALNMVRRTINEHGAHMGCTHYIGAAMGPLMSTLQQLKQLGLVDAFQVEPRLKKYAEFEMNFSTPPDPRFDNRRVRPAIGDSEPGEATEFLGQLATAYADIDPDLSARLMGAWKQAGKPESDFHGATILKIDETLPEADPKLASIHFEGWYSALRFGWGTPNETVAWFVNGGFYSDHASNDLGEPIIYALSAPLSLDFGTMYSPHSPGGFLHSVVLPEASIGAPWLQNPPDVTKGPRWRQPVTEEFASEPRQAWSRARFTMGETTWTRTVKVAMLRDDLPAIGIRDEFGGGDAEASKVFLLNLMADGPVETPEGPKNVGQGFVVPTGVTRLRFTGQVFDKHPTGGIDWDLYVIADAPQEAFLAQYEHNVRGGEKQTILRLRGTGRFQVVIVPWYKGAAPANVGVERARNVVTVSAGAAQATF